MNKIYLTILLLTISFTHQTASAMTPLEEGVASRISAELAKYIDHSDFIVGVKLENLAEKRKSGTLSYLPKINPAMNRVAGQSFTDIAQIASKATIEISLHQAYQQSTKDFISRLLSQRFGIGATGRIDEISYIGFELDIPRSDQELKKKLDKTSDTLTDKEKELEKANKKNVELETKLEQTIKEQEKAMEDTSKKLSELERENSEAKSAAKADILIKYKEYILGFLAVAAIIVASIVLSSSFRKLGSLDNVSKSIAKFAEKDAGGDDEEEDEPSEGSELSATIETAQEEILGSGWSIDDIERKLTSLKSEIEELVDEDDVDAIATYIVRLISRKETESCVVTLEFIGKDLASKIYQKLDQNQMKSVFNFLQKGEYSKPKFHLMLKAGENLKSYLVGSKIMGNESTLNRHIKDKLLLIGDADLLKTITGLNQDQLTRVLFYYTPEEVTRILEMTAKKQPEISEKIIESISKLPDAVELGSVDDSILQYLDFIIAEKNQDRYSSYQNFYKRLIEESDEDIAEKITDKLKNIETMKTFLANEVRTFSDFFLLKEEYFENIISAYSISDIAYLVYSIQETEKESVLAMFNDQEKILIDEELKTIATQSVQKAQQKEKSVKSGIVKRMTKLSKNTPFDQMVAENFSPGGNNVRKAS